MLMLNRLQTRLLHTTPVRHDMRPQLKKLWDNHQANQKPLDKGTALILGAPAVACFALYVGGDAMHFSCSFFQNFDAWPPGMVSTAQRDSYS